MSVCFVACLCVPEIRSAIKDAIVEWYDDYIEIYFSCTADETPPLADPNGIDPDNALPTTIEKKAYATYLPEGYVERVRTDNTLCLILTYEVNEDIKFSLKQTPVDKYLVWADSVGKNVTQESVNGFMAILTVDEENENLYNLVWQTDAYEISLYGIFESKEELFKIAEGIKTE